MMTATERLRLLDNVALPPALSISVTDNTVEFFDLKVQLNGTIPPLFGTAYRQGNRLHFATGMSIRHYLSMVRVDQSKKGSNLEQARAHANRPKEASHGKAIGAYLNETACAGLPFIFPAFLVNYGLDWTEDMPKAKMTLLDGGGEALAWPAILQPPESGGLPVTDGGHRTDELITKFRGNNYGHLGENAISVIFVFESDIDAYHQDFSDCAKAKAMARSLTSSWDRRDEASAFGVALVESNKHLSKLIDATSNSVNLSSNSKKAWSMSALKASITDIYKEEVDDAVLNNRKATARLSAYFDRLFVEIPILTALTANIDKDGVVIDADALTPAKVRNTDPYRGGCVLLRGVGLAVLTQAFKYGVESGVPLDQIAMHMGVIDWYVLKASAPPQGQNELAYQYVAHAAQPIWINMLAMMASDQNFRIKGTHEAAEKSFNSIRSQLNI